MKEVNITTSDEHLLQLPTCWQFFRLVELIGGTDTARELVLEAISNGKHIVTANKALIALHGDEVFAAGADVRRHAGSLVHGAPGPDR